MRNLDLVLSDLEWRRLLRRIALSRTVASILNVGTWALIAMLKLATR